MSDLVTIATHLTAQEAAVKRSYLEAAGITVYTLDEQAASNMLGQFSDAFVGGVKLQVAASDVDRARELLEDEPDHEEIVDAYRVRRDRSVWFVGLATAIGIAGWIALPEVDVLLLVGSGLGLVTLAYVVGGRVLVWRCSECLSRVQANDPHCSSCDAPLVGNVKTLAEATQERLAREDEELEG